MNSFPAPDPIPLPAPVWLFKLLHIVTLSLHFVAVQMFLGGLALAVIWSLLAQGKGNLSPYGRASALLGRRLPVVMTYVINFGVPPLLFAQVLYGQALYTSSVLIGAWWIAIIFSLTLCYWILYKFAERAEQGRVAWPYGLVALAIAGEIARLFSSNMTLMLRPEVWARVYATTASGTHVPHDDPTTVPRWLCMLAGSLLMAGLWMLYQTPQASVATSLKCLFRKAGVTLLVCGTPLTALCGYWVLRTQPDAIQAGLLSNALYHWSGILWLVMLAASFVLGSAVLLQKTVPAFYPFVALVFALLVALPMTTFRDGIRDLSLSAKGLDVWRSPVVTNWSVVVLFLILFVAGIGVIGWLIAVMAKAKPSLEGVQA